MQIKRAGRKIMATEDQIREQARQWFVVLRDDEAPESLWLDFCGWLEADDRHRAAYDGVEAIWLDLDEASGQVTGEDTVIPFRPRVTQQPARFPMWRQAFAMAATLVIAVGAWVVFQPTKFTTYQTEAQPRTIMLADGSTIYMNRHSELSVSADADKREVRLEDGEAAFDVVHDAAHPFTVEAGGREVRVLGTAFNVLSHGNRFEVAVSRGVVEVALPQERPTRLTAGRKLSQREASVVVSAIQPDQAAGWRNGVLIYRDSGLSEVAEDLSRYFSKQVTLDPTAASLRFTGALQLGDEATMLKQLQDFVPVRINRSSTAIELAGRDPR